MEFMALMPQHTWAPSALPILDAGSGLPSVRNHGADLGHDVGQERAGSSIDVRSMDAMAPAMCAIDTRTEHPQGRASWLHTPKFGPTRHFQRWRPAT